MKKISAFLAVCLLIGGAFWMGDTRTREKTNGAVTMDYGQECVPYTFPVEEKITGN